MIKRLSNFCMIFTAGGKNRNYILDQTNVYSSARKRKLRSFREFKKIAAVLVCTDEDLAYRSHKRTFEDGEWAHMIYMSAQLISKKADRFNQPNKNTGRMIHIIRTFMIYTIFD